MQLAAVTFGRHLIKGFRVLIVGIKILRVRIGSTIIYGGVFMEATWPKSEIYCNNQYVAKFQAFGNYCPNCG